MLCSSQFVTFKWEVYDLYVWKSEMLHPSICYWPVPNVIFSYILYKDNMHNRNNIVNIVYVQDSENIILSGD
jgi:hypothetical protein